MTKHFEIKNLLKLGLMYNYYIISHPEYGVVGIICNVEDFKQIQYAN